MDKVLGYPQENLMQLKGLVTAKEIVQQPEIWLEAFKLIFENRQKITSFLDQFYTHKDKKIILCGAGSSAFVGKCAQTYLNHLQAVPVEVVETTDLVSHPSTYLKKDQATLMISFARSGNSPESIGAIALADQIVDHIYHLILTCNPNGELAKKERVENTLVHYMPIKANDQGFAMTGSFTSMLLSTLLIFHLEDIHMFRPMIEDLCSMGISVMNDYNPILKELSNENFERIVYLGAASMKGMAEESALKILELTAGKIGTLYNSPLGFRHGPKSYLDKNTFVVFYISGDAYSRKYDLDLLKEVSKDGIAKKIIVVCNHTDSEIDAYADLVVDISTHGLTQLEDVFINLPYLMVGQILAFHKSIKLKITPDNPSPSGLVNRVVQGVTIYPFLKEEK